MMFKSILRNYRKFYQSSPSANRMMDNEHLQTRAQTEKAMENN